MKNTIRNSVILATMLMGFQAGDVFAQLTGAPMSGTCANKKADTANISAIQKTYSDAKQVLGNVSNASFSANRAVRNDNANLEFVTLKQAKAAKNLSDAQAAYTSAAAALTAANTAFTTAQAEWQRCEMKVGGVVVSGSTTGSVCDDATYKAAEEAYNAAKPAYITATGKASTAEKILANAQNAMEPANAAVSKAQAALDKDVSAKSTADGAIGSATTNVATAKQALLNAEDLVNADHKDCIAQIQQQAAAAAAAKKAALAAAQAAAQQALAAKKAAQAATQTTSTNSGR